MDIIKTLKDVITVAQKSNDIEMVQKVIAAQEEVIELQDKIYNLKKENSNLKDKLKRDMSVIRYRGIPVLSIKGDKAKILYCSNCYGNENKLIPVHIIDNKHSYCRVCGDQCELNYSADFEQIKEFLD